MKIKRLGSLISKSKALYIYDEANGRQWAGDGQAAYLLPMNLPEMSAELLTTILDIPPEKAAEYLIERKPHPEHIPVTDNCKNEIGLIFDMGNRLIYEGRDMLPVQCPDDTTYLIPTKALGPVSDSQQLLLFLRMAGNRPYIAVKDGLFLVAMIGVCTHHDHFYPWLTTIDAGVHAAACESISTTEEYE